MRIQSQEALVGYPSVRIRHLVRRWGWGKGGVALVKDVMEISETAAAELVAALVGAGYIEKATGGHTSPGWEYELTVKGTALAQASAAAPLRRETVRLRLHELIERMTQVNADERFFVGVQDAVVFGSYLTKVDRLGDLDVHYTTYRKIDDQETFARVTEAAARGSGRRFSGFIDLLFWPETEVRNFLKNRSRVYSLGNNSELLRDEQIPRLVIFRGRAPVPGWRDL